VTDLVRSARARHRESTAVLGMTIFIASWAMLFASLFFAYAVTRLRALSWPPPDLPALPRVLPALGTLGLGASSLLLERARRRQAGGPLALAWLAAAGFLFVQIVVWSSAWRAGLRPETGSYASVFYGLTMFHGLHVLVGLAALAVLIVKPPPDDIALRLWAMYFHMVGVLWAVMFVGVYLL
jgi:cytochrome c oxidase subunit 3